MSTAIRPLIAELEHRSASNPKELHSLLAECHNAYLSTRSSLLGARVSDEVGKLDPRGSDLVDLVSTPAVARQYHSDRADTSWLQLPEGNLYGRIQPIQAYLPVGRISAIVSLCFRSEVRVIKLTLSVVSSKPYAITSTTTSDPVFFTNHPWKPFAESARSYKHSWSKTSHSTVWMTTIPSSAPHPPLLVSHPSIRTVTPATTFQATEDEDHLGKIQ